MFKINKKIEYALICLKFMAERCPQGEAHKQNSLTTAREICEQFGTPFDTTAKVMQAMNHKGLLTSVQGIKGGYSLARSLKTVSYMDLVRMIEGPENTHYCRAHKGPCELFHHCNIVGPVDMLNKKIHQFLEDVNLHELLEIEFLKTKEASL